MKYLIGIGVVLIAFFAPTSAIEGMTAVIFTFLLFWAAIAYAEWGEGLPVCSKVGKVLLVVTILFFIRLAKEGRL